MQELTQSPEQKPGMSSDKAWAPITQTLDFEKATGQKNTPRFARGQRQFVLINLVLWK